MDVTNVSEKNTPDRELSNLERLGVVQMELMDIRRQKTALYGQEKAKEKEADAIYEQILLETREGKTIFDKGE